jgi:hypothetical protein
MYMERKSRSVQTNQFISRGRSAANARGAALHGTRFSGEIRNLLVDKPFADKEYWDAGHAQESHRKVSPLFPGTCPTAHVAPDVYLVVLFAFRSSLFATVRLESELAGASHILENLMSSLLQDLRFAIRQLRKNPGFAITTMFDAGARHRRDHGDVQPDQQRPAASAAVP